MVKLETDRLKTRIIEFEKENEKYLLLLKEKEKVFYFNKN